MHEIFPVSIKQVILDDDDLRKKVIGTIQNLRDVRRGLFLPDKAFENVAKAQIKRLKEPSIKCVSLVVKELTNILFGCTEHMSAYPNLREESEKILLSHVQDCEKKCKEHLDISIQVELGYLATK